MSKIDDSVSQVVLLSVVGPLVTRIEALEKAMRELPANVRINNLGAHLEPQWAGGGGDQYSPYTPKEYLPWPTVDQLWDTLWDAAEHIGEPQGASVWFDPSKCVLRRKDVAVALAKLKTLMVMK